MTPAEQEAYASCTSRTIQLCTIELNHPEFTQPLYAVRDNQDLTAELEDGSTVTFLALGFDITRQPTDKEPDPTITLKVDNITGKLSPYLEAAARSGKETSLTFRVYLYDSDTETAELISDQLTMAVRSASGSMTSVNITAGFINPANLAFPREKFTADRFPGLPR
ncbi:DUF1833 family protein [Endozoicomonas sp. GU-1]|uniref:DUF1833 family protein n=1 Tax=Endozoicomonas sp. GU-1 TaxID=3009078 RepID=UPI0022B537DB|nr:DUF1833 family protein [Endozoicomonas sp. GU-1]WBA79543.1 DUF1833 family protein [Endozoicomonas sp. GU-1]